MSEWVNNEGIVYRLCSDEVKETLENAKNREYMSSDGNWYLDNVVCMNNGTAYRCKVKVRVRRLCEDVWPLDLKWKSRFVNKYGGSFYSTSENPVVDGNGWGNTGQWITNTFDVDNTDWKNSLEKREDCKCEGTFRTLCLNGKHLNEEHCLYCKLPVSRHNVEDRLQNMGIETLEANGVAYLEDAKNIIMEMASRLREG